MKVNAKLVVDIEKYTVQMEEDNQTIYITEINPNITLEIVRNNIKANGVMTIYEKDGTKVTDNNQNVRTGMKLKANTEEESAEYTFVVIGDNNGDGKFNSIDLLKLARYLVDLDKNLSGEYLYASDVHKDGKVNQIDLLKMARVISDLDKFE